MKKAFSLTCLFLLVLLLMPQLIRAEDVQIQVTVEKANVRAKPDLRSEIVIQVSLGTVLISDMMEGNWYRIILPPDENGVRRGAFIHNSVVEVLTKDKPAEAAQPVEPVQPEVKQVQPTLQVQPVPPERVKVPREGGMQFGFTLKGGLEFFIFGRNDIHSHFQGMNDGWAHVVSSTPLVSLSGAFEETKSGLDLGGEFFFNFTPQLGIGLGIGYIQQAGKESGLLLGDAGLGIEFKATPKISAIPILMTFHFGIPIGNIMDITASAGGGLYLGTVQYDQVMKFMLWGMWEQFDTAWKAKSNALGFHGGLGFAFHLSKFMDLVLDISGRLVNFKSLTADAAWVGTSNMGPSSSGTDTNQTLWYFESEQDGLWFSQVMLDDTKPSAPNTRNEEEAVVGLSGLSLQLGLRLKLSSLFKR